VVTGAIAVSAPPLIQAMRTDSKTVTVAAALAGAVLTLTATGGQLAVITWAAHRLDLGGAQNVIPWIGGLGMVLLLVYTVRSLSQNLYAGKGTRDAKRELARHIVREWAAGQSGPPAPAAEEPLIERLAEIRTAAPARRTALISGLESGTPLPDRFVRMF
jgi:hypothetical protein